MNLTRAVGIVAGVMFLAGVAFIAQKALSKKKPPEGVTTDMPAFEMEFVKSDEELPKIIGGENDESWREGIIQGIRLDYGLIALYWLLFAGIALVLARGGERWALWVAAAAALCATAAAASDVVENVRMVRVVENMSLGGADVKTPGFLKWLASFVTLALLSFTFFGRQGRLVWVIGALCLVIAGLGFVGLARVKSGAHEIWPIKLAFLMMLLLSGLVAYVFIFKAEALAPRGGS